MADPKKMSVEEMLAAARAEKQGGAKPDPAAETPKPETPAGATPPAGSKKPSEMSVADMLAAARGEKSGGKKTAAKKPAAASPKADSAKAKPTAKSATQKPAAAVAKDTQSILAAARTQDKPGPMSKSEAAAKGKAPVKAKRESPPMPEKPAYAMPAPAPRPTEGRRTFLGALCGVFCGSFLSVGFWSLGLTHLLWGLGMARFMFPNILTEPPTRFKVGFADDFAPGMVETKFKAQFGVWIVRDTYEGQPQIFALKSVCTHLGCTPNWLEAEQKFKCPCHGSGFYKDGVNFEGPAPRPLERYAIQPADDGQLEVDKSRKFQEEMGQWQDPASFVPV